jgi:hypothetical protein
MGPPKQLDDSNGSLAQRTKPRNMPLTRAGLPELCTPHRPDGGQCLPRNNASGSEQHLRSDVSLPRVRPHGVFICNFVCGGLGPPQAGAVRGRSGLNGIHRYCASAAGTRVARVPVK